MNLIEKALKEYGIISWEGKLENPEVLKYFHEIGYEYINSDETPWCAAFLNWILKQCNIKGTNLLNARSFLKIGIPVSDALLGDLVVLWRISQDGPYGHCGIFIKETDKLIWILGGNEDSSVKIKPYPKTQLLGYRRIV